MPHPTPNRSCHCRAPGLQRQPPHRAVIHVIDHTWPVSRSNSSFSRVRSRKRHEKRAVGHSMRHTVHLLQVHANCGELWKEMAAPKQRKQQHVRHRYPHLGSNWGDHRARLCMPHDAPPLTSAPRRFFHSLWEFDFRFSRKKYSPLHTNKIFPDSDILFISRRYPDQFFNHFSRLTFLRVSSRTRFQVMFYLISNWHYFVFVEWIHFSPN